MLYSEVVVENSGQSCKQFTLIIYDSKVIIQPIFLSGTTLARGKIYNSRAFIRLATGQVVIGGESMSKGRQCESQQWVIFHIYLGTVKLF